MENLSEGGKKVRGGGVLGGMGKFMEGGGGVGVGVVEEVWVGGGEMVGGGGGVG